jgi:hypothetical protein
VAGNLAPAIGRKIRVPFGGTDFALASEKLPNVVGQLHVV